MDEASCSLELFGVDALFFGIMTILLASVCFSLLPPPPQTPPFLCVSFLADFELGERVLCVQFLCGSWFVFTINRADF